MPVLVAAEHRSHWLDAKTDRALLQGLLVASPEDALEAVAVSQRVNSPRNDDERCIEPMAQETIGPS